MERRAVARHYLRTWLAMDLLASLPVDLLIRGRRFDILRLPRLLKVIRIMHMKTLMQAGARRQPWAARRLFGRALCHCPTTPLSVPACLDLIPLIGCLACWHLMLYRFCETHMCHCCIPAMQSLTKLYALWCAVHDLQQMPLVANISRFHIQIGQLFTMVLIWVHWNACLQYGACAAQAPSRCSNAGYRGVA